MIDEIVLKKANQLKVTSVPILRRLVLEVISICNCNCIYCYLGSRKNDKLIMDFDTAKDIINMACKYKIESIYLTGGEPLLNPDIFKIIDYASKMNFKEICLLTNGSLINHYTAKKLSQYPINVAVGVMTHDSYIGQKLHGANYMSMKNGLLNLLDVGFSNNGSSHLLAVGSTIMKANCNNIIDFYFWVKSNNILWSGIEPLICAGYGNIDQYPPINVIKSIVSSLAKFEGISNPVNQITPFCRLSGCNTFANQLYIKENYSVKMCGPSDFELGNLKKSEIMEIWENNPILNALRHYKEICDNVCSKCTCNCIGCPVTTFNITGNLFSSYPFCWHEEA